MRCYSSCLFLIASLVLSGAVFAKQGPTPPVKNADKPEDTKNVVITKPVENWRVVGDIKTGLQPAAPFEVQKDEQPEFVRELLRVEWRLGDSIELWVVRPKKPGKVPVVLYLYSYPTENDRFRDDDWCKRATAGGFAAVGFVSALTGQRYHYRPMKEWFVSELTEALGSSVHDVQLVLNYLADRGDFDMDRVGMFGMGSGASIAILAAEADPRIKTLDLLDPWGDWPDWLRESPAVPEAERSKYTTEQFLNSVAPLDPVAYLPSLKTRNLRLQQTLSEPVTPKTAKQRIAASVHDSSQLVIYANANDLFKAWQSTGLSGWIKQQLQSPTAIVEQENRSVALSHRTQ